MVFMACYPGGWSPLGGYLLLQNNNVTTFSGERLE